VAEPSTAFPSTVPAGPQDRRLAFAVIAVSSIAFLISLPFAKHQLAPVWPFMPMYDAAISFSDLMTASLLFMQFKILRAPALLGLASGYLFTGLMVVPHALTFPGLFSEPGLLGAGPHTTAWVYIFWHAGFPFAAMAYAALKNRTRIIGRDGALGRHAVLLSIGAVVAAVVALTLLATVGQSALPDLMTSDRAASGLFIAVAAVLLLTTIALVVLRLSGVRTVLDLWLSVVLCTWLLNVALSAFLNGGRFDLGFYAGRVYGMMAASFVLLVLLRQTGALYARLAGLLQVEQLERQREMAKRRDAEAKLSVQEERERLFVAAVESSEDAIVITALDGTITGWNPAAERLFGYAAAEIVGETVEMIVPEERRIELGDILARIGSGDRLKHHETVRIAKSGKPIQVSLSISPIRSPSDAIIAACAIARDITDQKRIERMKDEFIATVSHELRTPVTTMAGPLGLLANGAVGEMPEKAKRLIAMAHNNCVRLTRLVNDILDFEKIEAGMMTFNFRTVDVKGVVRRAIEGNLALAEQFGVSVRFDGDDADVVVDTDSDRLTEVLAQLLSNAVKFSPRGEEAVVSIESGESAVRVAVRDRGPGVPVEFKTLIFEKFAQVEATDARRKGGNGLGLSIAKQTMRWLGGEIDHVPASSGGTIFYIDLPYRHLLNPQESAAFSKRRSAGA